MGYIIANQIPENNGNLVRDIKDSLAFCGKDFSLELGDQFLYGVVFGWSPESYKEFGMSDKDAGIIIALHNLFEKLSNSSGSLGIFDLEDKINQAVWVQPKGDPTNGKWGVVKNASWEDGALYLWDDPTPYHVGEEYEVFITKQMSEV